MKIKDVCKETGLTDRTIRYYIEEKLISPSYTENYLGRKTFDFSYADVKQLRDISTLRKFDFSVDEVRSILMDAENSKMVIKNVTLRIEQTVSEKQSTLSALQQLKEDQVYTVSELASNLLLAADISLIHNETVQVDVVKMILSFFKSAITFLVVWSPIVVSIFMIAVSLLDHQYPVVNSFALILNLLFLVPSALTVLISKFNFSWKRILRRILLVLCIFSIPFNFLLSACVINMSKTTDIRNYRKFDAQCLCNRDLIFQELFPTWPHYFENAEQSDGSWSTVYLDAHYLYQNLPAMDYTYDIYAEWPLEKEEFDKEVARVTTLFEEKAPSPEDRNRYCDYIVTDKGSYTCLALYSCDGGDPLFEKVTGSYSYYIFAYDEQNLKVRYIYCCSLENGADQPYYLSLDWD